MRSDYKSEMRPATETRLREIFFIGTMKSYHKSEKGRVTVARLTVMIFFIIVMSGIANAQEFPPRPIEVVPTVPLTFGVFTPGATGGTVTVTEDGFRNPSGTVVLLSFGSFSPAQFDVTANPGTLISFLIPAPVVLPGSNGGSMTLTLIGTNPVSPFVTTVYPPLTTPLSIGGRLTVGNILANPPGSYSGLFNITLVQE